MTLFRTSLRAPSRLFASIVLFAFATCGFAQDANVHPVAHDVVDQRFHDLKRNNADRAAELRALFQQAGCSGDHLTNGKVPKSKLPNIICVLPGSGPGVLIVGAHFDHVDMGMGAIDNWTGASLLPSLYQALAAAPPRHTVIFIGFTDEEVGLVGSRAYVAALTPEQKAAIRGMINMDSFGLGPTDVWANVADGGLLNLYRIVAERRHTPVHLTEIPKSDADSDAFSQAAIPALTLHSISDLKEMKLLHSVNDQPKAVNVDDLYGSYLLIVDYLQQLDRTLP